MTRTFLVKADIGNALVNGIRLGQTAAVQVELPRTPGVTKLPLSALREERCTAAWFRVKPAGPEQAAESS